MKQTDYKFWYVTRGDNVHISKVAVRFFEGEVSIEKELGDIDKKEEDVERYRRSKRLQKSDLTHLTCAFEKESSGDDAAIYTNKDFGEIKDEDELRCFLNKELAKDKIREPNSVQKETTLSKIKALKLK